MHDELLLTKTKEVAKESEFIKINGKPVKVGSSIYLNNRLISKSVNSNKTHPMMAKYNEDAFEFSKVSFLHAEMAALISASKQLSPNMFPYCTIYVARKLNRPGYGLARPCKACMEAIKEFGIKKIVYTTDTGFAVEYIRGEENE